MPGRAVPEKEYSWNCPGCSERLQLRNGVFLCPGCGQQFPIVQGVAVLVRNPIAYLRSEISALDRARRGAIQRRGRIEKEGPNFGLMEASLRRHVDVLDTEIVRAETFLSLLEPARAMLTSTHDEQPGATKGSGWGFDALFPYLLRDWTNTQELSAAASIIGEAIQTALPDCAAATIAFAGCGAAGLLDEIPLACEHVIGFDLTFPVLAAARHLLDGNELDAPMPRAVNAAGSILLRRNRDAASPSRVHLAAMDAFETAFAGNSVDCVVTSFFLDLLPDPTKLAKEIHRILCPDGVWINYGPSGPLQSLWRFDDAEGRAFFQAAGFNVLNCNPVRATYLDLSRDCPSWSFQNHVCYLTVARKTSGGFAAPNVSKPRTGDLLDAVPEHNRGAVIIRRQRLDGEGSSRLLLQYEGFPGRNETFEINNDAARILDLVDGKRTVREIARLAQEFGPAYAANETARILANYLEMKVLKCRPV